MCVWLSGRLTVWVGVRLGVCMYVCLAWVSRSACLSVRRVSSGSGGECFVQCILVNVFVATYLEGERGQSSSSYILKCKPDYLIYFTIKLL